MNKRRKEREKELAEKRLLKREKREQRRWKKNNIEGSNRQETLKEQYGIEE